MIYINKYIDRKSILKLKIKRNGKVILFKNIWVKKHDNIIIEQEYKNNKNKGEYFKREIKRNKNKHIRISKKEKYIMEKYMGNIIKNKH
jgi:hypothetical protein